jgi:hypothetical protein
MGGTIARMAKTPSTTGVNPEEELAAFSELADHLSHVFLEAREFPNALSMVTELEESLARLREFFEAGGYQR